MNGKHQLFVLLCDDWKSEQITCLMTCDSPSAWSTLLLLCFVSRTADLLEVNQQHGPQLSQVWPMHISQSSSQIFGRYLLLTHLCVLAFISFSLFLYHNIHSLHYWLHILAFYIYSIHLFVFINYFAVNKCLYCLVYSCVSPFLSQSEPGCDNVSGQSFFVAHWARFLFNRKVNCWGLFYCVWDKLEVITLFLHFSLHQSINQITTN